MKKIVQAVECVFFQILKISLLSLMISPVAAKSESTSASASTQPASQEVSSTDAQMHLVVKAVKHKKVALGLVVVGHQDSDLKALVERLQKDLQWSGQCEILHKHVNKLDHESQIKNMFDQQVNVVIFLSKEGHDYAWRLYDVESVTMIAGKKMSRQELSLNNFAHAVADEIWPILFGTQSSFRSKIAFCKEIWKKKHGREKPYKQIWIADFDGSNAQLFINAPTVSFAPRWNNDVNSPLLMYSQNTLTNVQLVLSNMFGKRKVMCSFDGLNMQPTFSKDGKKNVFCLSKDGSSQLYLASFDVRTQKRKFERLTFNDGENISPCFVDDTHVAFVSDFETHKPQIYILDLANKSLQRITDGGYCACPNYSFVRRQLIYSKMMGNGMQLWTYDVITQQHMQVTKGAGSKEEASWSPCGNYLIFGYNDGNISRIAQYHMPTHTLKFLTSEKDNCTYPAVSPIYQECIGILNH